MPYNLGMYEIEPLQRRLADAPSVLLVSQLSGVSSKQICRIKAGESSPSLRTAAAIMSALDRIEPHKRKKSKAA